MADVVVEVVTGEAIRPFIPALARLRMTVFREYPYLYDGTEAYEASYLEDYARSREAVVVLAAQAWLPEPWSRAAARAAARRQRWVYDAACDDSVIELVRFGVRKLGLRETRAMLRLAFAHDVRDRAAAIAAPTLLVVGARETPWARASTRSLAGILPGAVRVELEGVAHLHPLSAPDRLVAAFRAWSAGDTRPR